MKIIVAVDRNWGIGRAGGLLFDIPKDMAFFRKTTLGKVVVVGAVTFAGFPHGALPGRTNIVLDADGRTYPDALSASDLPSLKTLLSRFDADDVFVIGGASVYKLLLADCTEALVTKVDEQAAADAFFPNLDEMPDWSLAQESLPVEDNGHTLHFCKYVHKMR